MSNFEISVQFFLQVAFILGACRVVGWIARKFGQPQVVGEMIAGVLLGPSLLGWLLPGMQGWLFPKASMGVIYITSQVGLALYMFLVGVDFRVDLIKSRLRCAAAVSVTGIVAPFLLGGLVGLKLSGDAAFFLPSVLPWEALLFLGAAMSVTAFPVLARIIKDAGLTGTSVGTLALAAASIDDVAAWCILSVVLATFSREFAIVLTAVGGGIVYVLVLFYMGRPWLRRLGKMVERKDGIDGPTFSIILMLLMTGAWFTEIIGIHAVFGAFLLGTAMPRGLLTTDLRRYLGPLTENFLLPLFFVYSGLNTRIDLLHSAFLWEVALLLLLVACLGKGIACWLAARLNGEDRWGAMAIGALMNARGLMELVMLNIGLARGIITPVLFTMMVMMAGFTTLLAFPVFEIVRRRSQKHCTFEVVTALQPVGSPVKS